ncbi:MAG: glycosyltransferase family 2 protein [Alphaproteobacteria bacterium]|nr:glycosyltransferase family 2 protein [Alphaproteobacteria bacterium]
MQNFENVSIILPTLNETFSFVETVNIILDECETKDIGEIIAVVCDRTTPESLESIHRAAAAAKEKGIPLNILYQTLPFAGGAVRDGITAAKSSHTLMMAPDLETDPHAVKDFIKMGKQFPNDMITASRWLNGGSFHGYNPVKFVLNWIFQKMFATFYGVRLTDMTFAYRLAPTELLRSVNWEELKHPLFLETCLKPIRLGVKIHEIPSVWAARKEGTSQNSLIQTFKYLKIAFKVKFERKEDLLLQRKEK